jgi:hypothetical protein
LFIFAGKKEPTEEICGTWVNTDYNKYYYRSGKVVINPDGTQYNYDKDNSNKSRIKNTYTIMEKWADNEGSIWYKTILVIGDTDVDYYQLIRIRDSGKIYEFMYFEVDYPTKIDPKSIAYRIYYRQ